MMYTLPDGRRAVFSCEKFRQALFEQQSKTGKRRRELLETMEEATHMSSSAIQHWMKGHNAPGDLEKVEAIAAYLETPMENLLKIVDEEDSEEEALELDETEENEYMDSDMDMFAIPVKSYDSEREALKGFYSETARYIETFRGYEDDFLYEKFVTIVVHLKDIRLDISNNTYNNLHSYIENFLQQIYIYALYSTTAKIEPRNDTFEEYMYLDAPWWWNYSLMLFDLDRESKDFHCFRAAFEQQREYINITNTGELDEKNSRLDPNHHLFGDNEGLWRSIIAEQAYRRLDEILHDYLLP